MMGFVFFVSLLGYALGLMLVCPKVKAGAALMCASCGMVFVSFWGVIMLEWMVPVSYALMAGGLLCLLGGVAAAALNRRNLRSRLLSPGLLFYVLACAWTAWMVHGTLIQDHDSLSYWARAVRELYTFDQFYIQSGVNMHHMDYIPLMASLQYSIVRVFGWKDAYLCYVPAVFCITGIAAMADVMPKKRLGLLAAAVATLAFGTFGFHFSTLRADGPMLMLFTAAMVCLMLRREDDSFLLPVTAAASVLTGFKIYTGLMYAVLIAAGMLCLWLKNRKNRALGWMILVSAVLILALQFGWSVKYNASMALMHGNEAGLAQLLSGNPRTGALMNSFTPENIEQFKELAGNTFEVYAQSALVWVWPFVIAALVWAGIRREWRAFGLMGMLLLAAVIYLGGLFASYFVQSETAGAAVNYLSTASAPLLIASAVAAVWLAHGVSGYVIAVLMAIGMIVLHPPVIALPAEAEYEGYAALAYNYYYDELDGILTEDDRDARAFVIDCTYEASEIKSPSGKTHSYQYFGLPMRVQEPVYYTYGDYVELDYYFDPDELYDRVANADCDLLMLRIEDEFYWEAVRDALGLWGDWDEPLGVYDISEEDGELIFTIREW